MKIKLILAPYWDLKLYFSIICNDLRCIFLETITLRQEKRLVKLSRMRMSWRQQLLGSDAASLKTTAELKGNEWILNGTKQFITNIGLDNALFCLIAARVNDESGKDRISAFIVPKDASGFKVGKRYRKIAWNASATHEVILDDCKIPKENLLGDPSKGLAQHLSVLQTQELI